MADRVIHETRDSGGVGFLLGVVLLIGLIVAFWVWGMPMLRREETNIDITNEVPQNGTPEIPTEIDVNITGAPSY